ncbi:helix-turn-helix domain-containing protein [Streptomyces sp. NPDC091204]|uniref:helix-turn-helix domain-containing protein n=1 Tax=Streptomyces sp. NPDC091204 TaxID=3155299 RepID=UPI00343429F2
MSGRPEKPIPSNVDGDMAEFAKLLREMRAKSGLTYRQLAERSHTSPSNLSRAASGASIPAWPVVESIALAAQVGKSELGPLKERWLLAAGHRKDPHAQQPQEDINEVVQVVREHQKSLLLQQLYKERDRPSVRKLADKTGLSRSTVHRALSGKSRAGMGDVFEALAASCPSNRRRELMAAWQMADSLKDAATDTDTALPITASSGGSEADEAVTDFLHALRRVRNLVAHGGLTLDPLVAAQILTLQATIDAGSAPKPSDAPRGAASYFAVTQCPPADEALLSFRMEGDEPARTPPHQTTNGEGQA